MQKTLAFLHTVQDLVSRVLIHQFPAIEQAGEYMAQSMMAGGYVFIFGTGHSHMMAEELFYRAGGHARIYPILDERLMLHKGAVQSTASERLGDYAKTIFETLPCSDKDCMIIASNSGRNAVTIEMAKCSLERKMPLIALTNLRHSRAQDSRHVSGKKLFELADVVLDNGGCLGDASILFDTLGTWVGPTSTILGATLLQACAVSAAEQMVNKGFEPEIFSSSNLDKGDDHNQILIEKYRDKIRSL